MEFVIGAASWALGKALASAKDSLAETWAASKGIGDKLDALEIELMHAQWILDDAHVKQSHSMPLKELLVKLRQLAYEAADVLDELEYYRIQDTVDGTHHATDVDDNGGGLLLHARSTATAIGKRLTCCSSPSADADGDKGRFFSRAWPSKAQQRIHDVQTPKLKFDRVEMSTKMNNIAEKLKPVCAKFSAILDKELLAAANLKLEALIKPSNTNHTTTQRNAMSRPITTHQVEPELYGRDRQLRSIIEDITHGEYFNDVLTVLPIVGPGGAGKTTLVQQVYQEVMSHFQVTIWTYVSLNFNAIRLAQEVVKCIPKVDGEKENATDQELIEQRLKYKRFLLVLDDVWTCHEDDWNLLLAPLRKGQEKGNIIIVTTRIPTVAQMVKTVHHSIDLQHQQDEYFMEFFKACIFHHPRQWEDYPELHDTGIKIARKLRGSPLAAKTVGRLLGSQLTLSHWADFLQRAESEQSTASDIMPIIKLSYDYLPFHHQRCISYLAMFPRDYEFHSKELIHLWIGLDILSYDQHTRIEDIGQVYLDELVDYGFMHKIDRENGCPFFAVHDLLHELGMKVQTKECITIYSSNVRSIQIPPTVRHLSIIVENKDVENRVSFQRYKKELSTLDRILKIENIRTLMLFGEHHGSFVMTFRDLLRRATALRAIYLSEASYPVDKVLCNFSRLVHLRYLNISSKNNEEIWLPSSLSRLYHLEVIDLQGWKGQFCLTTHMSNLGKLRHFLVPEDKPQLHSNILEVGKLKFFQELRTFKVGNKDKGFELSELGELTEIKGSVGIYNLENVQTKEEADESKLIHKEHIHKLTLEWGYNRSDKCHTREENVIESLKPHSNLLDLCIRGHGGNNCPTWLSSDLSVNNLESLHLEDVSWKIFPPLGELWFVNELGNEYQSCITNQSFQKLRRLELIKLQSLKKWTLDFTCALFLHLEELIIKSCSKLEELPVSNPICYHQENEVTKTWFPKLKLLEIEDCPNLQPMLPIPSHVLCSATIAQVGSDLEQLVYEKGNEYGARLQIEGKHSSLSTFWKVLDFNNLTELEVLEMKRCPPLSLDHLQMLSSLQTLRVLDSGNSFWMVQDESEGYFPVKCIQIQQCGVTGKELTWLLSRFPILLKLAILDCHEIKGIGVMEPQQQEGEAETTVLEAPGFLLLPPQLQELEISGRLELSLPSDSLNDVKETGGTRDRTKFQSSSSPRFPFPASLQKLSLKDVAGMETLVPLANLTSLKELHVKKCGDLRGKGLWTILSQGHLTRLTVLKTPKFFAGSEPSRLHEHQQLPSHSSRLQELNTDDVAGVLAVPICTFLSSSLTKLDFTSDSVVECFRKEQREALQLLSSLEELQISLCIKLQGLPPGLSGLPSLRRIKIDGCPAIRSLPKDGLPSSLHQLEIRDCPGIRSMPKIGLPSSLRVLNVRGSKSEKLRRHCSKLIETIPIVEA